VFLQDGDDSFQRLLTLSLWGQMERRIAVFRHGQCQ